MGGPSDTLAIALAWLGISIGGIVVWILCFFVSLLIFMGIVTLELCYLSYRGATYIKEKKWRRNGQRRDGSDF